MDSDVEKYHIEWSQQIPHDLRRSGTCIGSQLSFSTGDLKIQNVEDKNMVHVPNDIFLDYWETEKLTNIIEKEMFIEVVYSPNGKMKLLKDVIQRTKLAKVVTQIHAM